MAPDPLVGSVREDPKNPPLSPLGEKVTGSATLKKPKEERWHTPPPHFEITPALQLWRVENQINLSHQELVEATLTWRESRESRPNAGARTMGQWENDWKVFMRYYWKNHQRGPAKPKRHVPYGMRFAD
jgi:hypothetical protein